MNQLVVINQDRVSNGRVIREHGTGEQITVAGFDDLTAAWRTDRSPIGPDRLCVLFWEEAFCIRHGSDPVTGSLCQFEESLLGIVRSQFDSSDQYRFDRGIQSFRNLFDRLF